MMVALLEAERERAEAQSQAYSIVDKEWENRIAVASEESRYLLKKVRHETYKKSCSDDYHSDLSYARRTADVNQNLAAIRRQQRHCLEVLKGEMKMQRNPEHFYSLVDGLIQKSHTP